MTNEELLPKPQTDLPLPEKGMQESSANSKKSANLASQGLALRSYDNESALGENDGDKKRHQSKSKFIILGVVTILIFLGLIGAFVLGKNTSSKSTSIPSPSPVSYSPTPNPTADWKIYEKNGVSFKYPSDWKFEKFPCVRAKTQQSTECAKISSVKTDKSGHIFTVYFQANDDPQNGINALDIESTQTNINNDPIFTVFSEGDKNLVTSLDLSDSPGSINGQNSSLNVAYDKKAFLKLQAVMDFSNSQATSGFSIIQYKSHPEYQNVIEIFKSFKFTDSFSVTPTLTNGVVCTQDAMQCPDGTWVGRTGPNCEFAPCLP